MRSFRLLALATAAAALAACDDGITQTPVGGPAFEATLAPVTPVRTPVLTARAWSRPSPDGPIVDSITGLVQFTKSLDGRARYRFYVVNGVDSSAAPVAHLQVVERTDSILDANGNVQPQVRTTNNGLRDYWSGAAYGTVLRYRVTLSGTDSVQQRTSWLVLTIQGDSLLPGFTATTPRPLWVRFRDQRGTPARTDDTVFTADTLRGSYGTFRSPARQEVFVARGSGRVTMWDLFETGARRPVLSMEATNLTRPPLGYFYQPYLADTRSGVFVPIGTPVDAANTPLFAIDTSRADSVIAVARASFVPDTVTRPIREYTNVAWVLEPKTAVVGLTNPVIVPGATVALRATIPAAITSQRPANGVVRVIVTRGLQSGPGEPNVGAVILGPGSDFNTFLGSRNTDAAGVASFAELPSGRVRVVIVPPPGRTVVGSSEQFANVPAGSDVTVRFVVN
jgi:hypothetical protein